MANVRDLRHRIRSVKSIQQITRAMKMVAAARMRRAQERIFAARPYAAKIQQVMASLAARVDPAAHALLATRPERRTVLGVISADKGLCGSFNTNIYKRTVDFLRRHEESEVGLALIGKKGRDFFRRRPWPIRFEAVDLLRDLKLEQARELAQQFAAPFIAGEIDAVYLVYNEFKSILQQRVVVERLLPIERAEPSGSAPPIDYIYQPSPNRIYAALLQKHLEAQLLRCLLESAAAEHGARMSAMDSATNNTVELISSLTLTMNKIRQAAITKEIIEVSSGAEALAG
ncbi:MAG TPA: ATP synthase F1 subunit gamma [Acidobacteriota bacterium]